MKHITVEQRYTISVMKKQNYSQKEIAKAIGKDKFVVCCELKRNCDICKTLSLLRKRSK